MADNKKYLVQFNATLSGLKFELKVNGIKKLDENKIYDLINEIEKINSSDKSFENFIKNILKNKIFQIWDSKMSNL